MQSKLQVAQRPAGANCGAFHPAPLGSGHRSGEPTAAHTLADAVLCSRISSCIVMVSGMQIWAAERWMR